MKQSFRRAPLGAQIATGLAAAALFLVVFLAAAGARGIFAHTQPFPAPLPLPEGELSPEADSFRFAVLGDVQKGVTALDDLLALLFQEDPPVSFLLSSGDLVSHADEGHFVLLRPLLDKIRDRGIPLRVAPGNHDVSDDAEWFEKFFGPRQSWFFFRDSLFLLLDSEQPDGESAALAEAERILQEQGPSAKHVFVVSHIPPNWQSQLAGLNQGELAERWKGIFERTPVDYVFSGHEHGWKWMSVGDTQLVVNGRGGDYEGDFPAGAAHALVVTVRPDGIFPELLSVPQRVDLRDQFDHLAIAHLTKRSRALVGGILALAALLVWLIPRSKCFGIRRVRTKARRLYLLALILLGHPTGWTLVAGGALVGLGQLLHSWAAGYLHKEEVLCTSGPYRTCRNPMYVASFMTDLGFSVMAATFWPWLCYFPLWAFVTWRRVSRREEPVLREKFGSAFEEYCAKVPRFVPALTSASYAPELASYELGLLVRHREISRLLYATSSVLGFAVAGGASGSVEGLLAFLATPQGQITLAALVLTLLAATLIQHTPREALSRLSSALHSASRRDRVAAPRA